MAKPKSGLGKGLGALIQRSDQAEDGEDLPSIDAVYRELPIGDIAPNPRQPREHFDEQALAELSASIREVGLLQPVTVREIADGYELIMGERRWRAAQEAGLAVVPAIVRSTTDDELLREALLENLHRAQLNPLEEAAAYRQMLDDFGCTQDELAAKVQRSRSHVANTMRLLHLPATVQRRVAAGVLSAGHARALLGLADPVALERLAQRIVAEGLSVRATEEIVALGDREPVAARTSHTPREIPATAGEAADRLADRLDTRVRIKMGRSKGQIVIDFAEEEDLTRILKAL